MCVYSNSRNDVPRVAQRYGTIAACVRPRCVCSVLRAHAQFSGLIRRTPPPTFSDTAIIDRHSDTTFFQLRAHWVRISWSIGSENHSDMCRRWESNPRLPACKASTLSTRPGSTLVKVIILLDTLYTLTKLHVILSNQNKYRLGTVSNRLLGQASMSMSHKIRHRYPSRHMTSQRPRTDVDAT